MAVSKDAPNYDEWRRNLSKANKGQKVTEEQRLQISRAQKGKPKGPMSEETKAKLSASKKGRKLTEEHKQKLSAAKKGRPISDAVREARVGKKHGPLSEEHKKKIGDANRGHSRNAGRKLTSEARHKMSESRKGMKFSEEHVRNMSRVRKGVPRSPEVCKQLSETHKKLIKTPEHLENARKARQTPEARKRTGEISKALWEQMDEDAKSQKIAKLLNGSRAQTSGTKIEVAVWGELEQRGIEFVPQLRIGQYVADIYIPAWNAIIEVNGCYWHSCLECGYNNQQRLAKDKRRSEKLLGKGYSIVVIWEHAIKADVSQSVETAIRVLKGGSP